MNEFTLKPTEGLPKIEKPYRGRGERGGNLSIRATSVGRQLPHAPAQLRTHARTHARTTRTRNETETDFPIGISWRFLTPQSPILSLHSII